MNLGHRIKSDWLRYVMSSIIDKREPLEEIIHHYTDRKDRIQLEVERRSRIYGIKLQRIVFRG